MKQIIKTSVTALIVSQIFLTSCKKNTQEDTKYVQEEFTPENGGNGNGSGHCQCVAYVKRQLGITTSTANAKDWGITYPIGGYSLVGGVPQPQDIAVITPEFGGVDKDFGHIGFVNTITNVNGNDFNVNLISANYNSTNLFTSCNCNNVNTEHNISVNSNNRSKVRFYRNTSKILNCPDFTNPPAPTRVISLSGNLNFGSVGIGTTQSKPLTITNSGNSTLTINSISLPNSYTSDYNSGTIPTGNSTTANISFSPQSMASNYNGTITVTSNSTSGGNTISVTGSGVNTTPTVPNFSPSINTFTSCSFSNQLGSGNCAGNTFLGSTIHMKVASYNESTNTINFTIEKCSGSFSNSGTGYIKQGNYCGAVISEKTYAAGASSINLSATPPSRSGTYTYTAVLVSATTDKFYSLSISVNY